MASSSNTLDATRADRSFFGHPRGLATLFFTEMWERFCFYGMRALLILFLTAPVASGGLGFGVAKAGAIYGFYAAMVYLLSLPGGWLADRVMGHRKAVLCGGILIAAGELGLAGPGLAFFYSGLVLMMCGTGLLKPNVSTIVGQLYHQGDTRRDAGFSIFYMGINVGALIAPLICGYVGERISWRLGFAIAGFAMVIGVVQFMLGRKYLGEAGKYPAPVTDREKDRRQKRVAAIAAAVTLAVVATLAFLGFTGTVAISAEWVSNAVGFVLLAISVGVFSWLLLGKGWTIEERKRSGAILVLFLASALFWSMFEQAGSSLNLFADRSVHRVLFGFAFPASWFQFVQPFFVVTSSAGIRVDLEPHGKQGAAQPGEVFHGAAARRPGIPGAGGGRANERARGARLTLVAGSDLSAAHARRTLPESGGPERHDETGTRARGRLHDGDVVRLDQRGRFSRGQGRFGI